MPKHNDFQVFEVVRSNVQDSELKNPPKNDVTEREEHEPSRAARKPPRSYASDSDINVGFWQTRPRDWIYAPYRHCRLGSDFGRVFAQDAVTLLFVNHLGLYVMMLLAMPVGLVIVTLEERELVDRFGDDYRKYQREVPQFIPRWRRGN